MTWRKFIDRQLAAAELRRRRRLLRPHIDEEEAIELASSGDFPQEPVSK